MKKALWNVLFSGIVFLVCAAGLSGRADAVEFLGPSEYLSFEDSPFDEVDPFSYFYLEDFEDHLFNTPGASANVGGVTSVVFGPSIHDSVDADDGAIDGSGLLGDSFFSGSGAFGITFSFSEGELGTLPTHAGIVWTDGGGGISFEAFGLNGESLGVIGPFFHADGSFSGTTAEDRFYGVIDPNGISAIKILNSSGGIEVDHLQYGLLNGGGPGAIPEPTTLSLLGLGMLGLTRLRRKK